MVTTEQAENEHAAVEQMFTDAIGPAIERFIVGVESDAMAALNSDVMVAAGLNPFTLKKVTDRWGKVVQKARTTLRRTFRDTETDIEPMIRVLEDAQLPHETFTRMRAMIVQGADEGWSRDKLAKMIREAAGTAPTVTGLVVGSLATAVFAIVQIRRMNTNRVKYKKWTAHLDSRTRDSHINADGQVQLVGEPFSVGSALLEYPCDPGGPAAEVVNCRCILMGCNKNGDVVYADDDPLGDFIDIQL